MPRIVIYLSVFISACSIDQTGCTDPSACNFEETAINDDESCTYPEYPYDCFGDCLTSVDCNGECDGLAVTDLIGECCYPEDKVCDDFCYGIIDSNGDCCSWDDYIDNCGICFGNDDDMDCMGDCFGSAILGTDGGCCYESDIVCENICYSTFDINDDCCNESHLDDCNVCYGQGAVFDCGNGVYACSSLDCP